MAQVTDWRFLTHSEAAWQAMIESTVRAEKSIDLEQFVLGSDGEILESFAPLLMQKAKEGVRVRLLLDAVGSMSFLSSSLRTEMEEVGIQIVFHSTVLPPSLKRIIPAFLRDHRKLIVFDELEAHIGGVIIQERARAWRDTTVIIHGSLVEECETIFETAWEHAKHSKPVGRVLSNGGTGEFFLAGNSFHLRDKTLYSSIIRAIATAKKTVYITNPYFALTKDLRRALFYAKEQGVEVILLLPRRSDNAISDCIGRFYYGELLHKGIKIFHYTKSILHAKTMSVDSAWSTVGSCNLDWLSIWLNYELNLISTNLDFAEDLEEIFHNDISESEEVTRSTPRWYGFFGGEK